MCVLTTHGIVLSCSILIIHIPSALCFLCMSLSFSLSFSFSRSLCELGVAALRCFRVFRILFYVPERTWIKPIEHKIRRNFGPNVAEIPGLVLKVMKFSSQSLTALGQEMFFLTHATRGGFLLMLILFYRYIGTYFLYLIQ